MSVHERDTSGSQAESAETITLATGEDLASGEATAMSKRHRAPAEVPESIGRFVIQERLGSGGFGTVYRAHDPLLDRQIALKVPRLSDHDRREEELFLHEAKAAARLRHPNIVAVFECGMSDNIPYIASEFVDGTPLSNVLRSGRIPTRQAVEVVRKISEAIEYAHSEGIIHRDLKPDNIMMGQASRPQVMDFGLARLGSDAEKSLMSEGSIVGTPAYMSPEQARGDKDAVGPKSDQYSVGVLLYLMLCGELPYKGHSWSIISSVANPEIQPEAPRSVREEIPRDLEACCLKAIEKDPNHRYEDLATLADDLQRWLEGRPLLARPITSREQLVRWCGRNRLVAGMAGVIATLIFAALIVGYVLAFNFSQLATYANERANAEQEAKREVEQLLIDTYTESGLDAGRNGRHQEAVLWFGNAVSRSREHPRRERMNRARLHAWLRQTPMPVRVLRGHGHWHKSLVTHASGQFVLTEQHSPQGDRCRIWQVDTGELWPLPWDTEQIAAATWNREGDILALASGSEVRMFRFPDKELLASWKHPSPVRLLHFDQAGEQLAIACQQAVHLRDVQASDGDATIIPTTTSTVRLAWSPRGGHLATLCDDRNVYVWTTQQQVDREPMIPPLSCPFHSDPPVLSFVTENRLVVPESDEAVRCWDVLTGETIWSVDCGSDAQYVVAPDLSRVAIINKETVSQVSSSDGEEIGPSIEHPNLIYNVTYDAGADRLLTGCADHFARVFSADTGDLLASMRHGDMVHRVAWFPNDDACLTAHWKADLVRVWKLGVAPASGYSRELGGGVMHVKWSDDGTMFLPGGMDQYRAIGARHVLRTSDGSPVGSVVSFPGRASDGCFVPGTKYVVYGGSADAGPDVPRDRLRHQDLSLTGLIVAKHLETGESVFPPIETDANVIAIEASPDGRIIAALCHDHHLLIIDSQTGEILHRHECFPGSGPMYGFVIFRRLAFSPSGDRFAVWGSHSRSVEMRSAVDGSLLTTISHTNGVNANFLHNVTFSDDGSTIATCSSDQTVQLFDVESGQPRTTPLLHSGWVFSAEFSRDGERLLTACQDRQARLWDLRDVSKPVLVTPAQNDEVYATCFLPGEEFFLIGLRNGEVSVWDSQQGKMVSPPAVEANQNMIYSLALAPDKASVILVGRQKVLHGYPLTRWVPSVQQRLSRDDLRTLGETIAAQELYDGVLVGLNNNAVIDGWERLFRQHADHEMFQWNVGSTSVSP